MFIKGWNPISGKDFNEAVTGKRITKADNGVGDGDIYLTLDDGNEYHITWAKVDYDPTIIIEVKVKPEQQ